MTTTTHAGSFAGYACSSCRKQKRKCTKELPKCRLCERLHKVCDYEDARPTSALEEVASLQKRVNELETRLKDASRAQVLDVGTNHNSSVNDDLLFSKFSARAINEQFPAIFFLDSEVCEMTRAKIPEPQMSIPTEVATVLGGLNQIIGNASAFFKTVHLWFPFVSKKRMELALSNPNFQARPDTVALLLTIQLITDTTSHASPRSQLYFLAKNYIALLESHGTVSIRFIQANILIALYEIGHAIYPAAYLSPARAARLGQAYGIDNRRGAPQMGLSKLGSWAENEETKRTWWAVMILDRFVNLNIEGHVLATDEPHQNDVLPADCARWDNGEQSTSEPLYLFSPTDIQASPFARTCQATNLMGRFIRNRNDSKIGTADQYPEALQLHRTISALSKLLPREVVANPLQCGTSLALTYSTLLHIYDPYSCAESNRGPHTTESMELQSVAISGLRKIAADILEVLELLIPSIFEGLQASSPFVIECIYHAATVYAWLVHENGPGEMVGAYHRLKDQLSILSQRWRLAAEYLEILSTTKSALYHENELL